MKKFFCFLFGHRWTTPLLPPSGDTCSRCGKTLEEEDSEAIAEAVAQLVLRTNARVTVKTVKIDRTPLSSCCSAEIDEADGDGTWGICSRCGGPADI